MPGTKIYLAPFQGITTYTYREIYTKYFKGIDKLFTPFYTGIQKTKGLDKRANELNFVNQNGVEVVPQILSKDAAEIIRFSNYCYEKGFSEVNWNLGCPYPRVANKRRGSGLLPYPEMVDDILLKVMPEISIDLSIKCRLGYFSDNEIHKLIEVYNKHKISELTVHARIGKQLYKGDVNTKSFLSAAQASKITIVYNGDIFTTEGFKAFKSEFLIIDKWMIGRGLLMDPFLPEDIKTPSAKESVHRSDIIYHFITDLYLAYRKKTNNGLQTLSVLKELWRYMAQSFSNPNDVFNRIKKVKTFGEYEDAVYLIFKDFRWMGSRDDMIRK